MNQSRQASERDELRSEYDFSGGVRGKHHQAFRVGTNVVFLEPDVARVFTDSESVNQALRLFVGLARERAVEEADPGGMIRFGNALKR